MAKGYAGVSSKARNLTGAYIGFTEEVPVWTETTTQYGLVAGSLYRFFSISNGSGTNGWSYENYVPSASSTTLSFNYNTYSQFFSSISGQGTASIQWTIQPNGSNTSDGIKLVPNNIGINSTTATIILTAKYSCNISVLLGSGISETNYDKYTATVAGTIYANGLSGEISDVQQNIALSAGQTIKLEYSKDISNHGTDGSNEKLEVWLFIDPVTISSSGGTLSGVKFTPGNFGVHSSTASITLTALQDLTNVSLVGQYYTESSFDKITVTAGGTTYLNSASGEQSLTTLFSGKTLSKGSTIILSYTKDSSQSHSSEGNTFIALNCDYISVSTMTQTGSQTVSNVAKKVTKIYAGVNGIAQLIYGEGSGAIFSDWSYTGNATSELISVDGESRTLITMTSSGTLTLGENAEYWLCNGGNGGLAGMISDSHIFSGAGGGGGLTKSGWIAAGFYAVTIGIGGGGGLVSGNGSGIGGTTSIGSYSNANDRQLPQDGGSGGAGVVSYDGTRTAGASGGSGAGVSTYPFGIVSLYPHSGGGATCGVGWDSGTEICNGADGGSNGGDGGEGSTADEFTGIGGVKGGGNGANPATFYGGGGGGGWAFKTSDASSVQDGAAGYQGVAYILV